MLTAIFIIAYVAWLSSFVKVLVSSANDYCLISTLIVLLSWGQNLTWGICNLCAMVILYVIALAIANIRKSK